MSKRFGCLSIVFLVMMLFASFAFAQGAGGAKKNNLRDLQVDQGGGVFLNMHALGTENEVKSGSTNTDVSSASEFKLNQNALFGEHPSIDKNTAGEEKEVADFHTFLSGSENETFLFFGGMRGNADIMNSEAGVKSISQNLTGALPVYLSAVAFTEPAMHDSITESLAYSQRLVGQLYDHERHFLAQLETRPLMKRYVQDQLQACLHGKVRAKGDKGGEGKPWVQTQTECLGDSIMPTEEAGNFKNDPNTGTHFVRYLAEKAKEKHENSMETKQGEIVPTTVVGWIFDQAIEDSKIPFTILTTTTNLNYKVTEKMEEGKKMWLRWLGDYSVTLGDPTDGKDKGSIVLGVKTSPVKDAMDKRITQIEVLNNIAEKRFTSMMDLLKHRCEHKFADPTAHSRDSLTKAENLYKLGAERKNDNQGDANKIAIPGWVVNIAEIDALLAIFTATAKKKAAAGAAGGNDGKADCSKLQASEFRKFKSGTTTPSPAWAKKFNTLAYLHAGVYRLHVLSGMLNMVEMRAVNDGLKDQANAQLAVEMVIQATGFNHPQEGLEVVYGALQEFWAGIYSEVDKINNDEKSSLTNSDGQAQGDD